MNKRGIIMVYLLFVGFFAFQAAFIYYTSEKYESPTKDIGNLQTQLINQYFEGEYTSLAIETAAKISLHDAIGILSAKGGFPDCPKEKDYSLITHPDCVSSIDLYHKNLITTFEPLFTERLKTLNTGLTGYDYTYSVLVNGTRSYFTGKSTTTIPIYGEFSDYGVVSTFKHLLPLSSQAYLTFLKTIKEKSNCLKARDYNPLVHDSSYYVDTCNFEDARYYWEITTEGDTFFFTLTPKEKITFSSNISLKFAIHSDDLDKGFMSPPETPEDTIALT